MPEPFTLTGLSVLGGYVLSFASEVVGSVCKKSGEKQLEGFAGRMAERLKEGKIARNHDLEGALVTSLRETFFAFGHACREEDCRYDATGRAAWLAPVIARLTDAEQLKAALEEALPVQDGRDPAPRESARLGAPTLSPAFVQPPLVAAVGRAIAAVHGDGASMHRAWLTGKAEGKWTARREGGALVPNVTLAEVFAFSFREKIKHRAEVARLLTIDRLAAIDDKVDALTAAWTRAWPGMEAEAQRELGQRVAQAIGQELGARLDTLAGDLKRVVAAAEAGLAETRALRGEVKEGFAAGAARDAATQAMIAALPHRTRLGPVEPADYPGMFVGREAEMATVVRTVTAERPGTAVLIGEPGIGKSAIAHEAWRHPAVAARFGGRRWFVRCDEVRDRTALTATLASQLHLDVAGDDPWRSITAALNEAPGLLMLDNLEDLVGAAPDAAAAVLDELHTLAHLALVVTTRAGTWKASMGAAEVVPVKPLEPALLRTLLLTARGGGTSDPWARDPELDRLLREADGSPDVATHWARLSRQTRRDPQRPAEKVPLFRTPASLRAAWLGEADKLATVDPAYRPAGRWARQRGLDASYALSWASPRQTEGSRALLALLGVLPAGIEQGDLTVCAADPAEACDVIVDELGLAFFEQGRLRCRAPLRRFLSRAAPPSDAQWAAVEAHWLGLAATLGNTLGARGGAVAAQRLGAELNNLEPVLERTVKRAPNAAVAAAGGLAKFSRFTGLGDDRWLTRLSATTAGKNRANCIQSMGDIALRRSDPTGAKVRYEEAVSIFREVGDKLGEANCIRSLGDIALRMSDRVVAELRYNEAMLKYQDVRDKLGEANCIKGLGDLMLTKSDTAGARAKYEEAMPKYQDVGDKLGEANCIRRLGDIALGKSNLAAAKNSYEKAMPMFREVGDKFGEANCINGLGDIALESSEHVKAKSKYEDAMRMFQAVGSKLGEANCIKKLGNVALRVSDPLGAKARYEEAVARYRDSGDPYSLGHGLASLGKVLDGAARAAAVAEARACFRSIGRDDLLSVLDGWFPDLADEQ